jgi:hypothetical protein
VSFALVVGRGEFEKDIVVERSYWKTTRAFDCPAPGENGKTTTTGRNARPQIDGGTEMSATSKTTTDHEEIRNWVEERGGYPARVKGTDEDGGVGLLRVDFPGFSGEDTLERITWDEFFKGFEENNLAFLYQEETKDGAISRFSKLIDRDSTEEKSKAASS